MMNLNKVILSVFLITIFCIIPYNLLYSQTQGNIVRDVPGTSYSVFQCSDGQVLKFETSIDPPTWICAEDDAGADPPTLFDPTLGTYLFDDFIANTRVTSHLSGELGWDESINGGSVINGNAQDNVTSAPPNSERHPGVVRLTTSTSASGRAAISLGGTVNLGSSGMITAGGGVLVHEWLFQLYDLGSAGERFRIHLGLSNDWANNTLSWDAGLWIEYADNVNSGKFQYKYLASGTTDTVDSGLTAVADTWYKLRIVTNADWTQATFTINGANSQTITGAGVLDNTDSLSPGAKIVKSVGTSPRELVIDYFKLYQIFTTPRE